MTRPSPLQQMVRMHNFSMGTLMRTQRNIESWLCPSAKIAALSALEVERQVRKEEHERRKALLKAELAAHKLGAGAAGD